MDPSPVPNPPPIEEDDWDAEGYVIPSLGVADRDYIKEDVREPADLKHSSPEARKEEKIYLGPHGAFPSQVKQQELHPLAPRQRFKQKLKEADKKSSGAGRENKLENLRELVGSQKVTTNMSKGRSRDWLDPHCHEAQFEK